jgi:hypothetical protein
MIVARLGAAEWRPGQLRMLNRPATLSSRVVMPSCDRKSGEVGRLAMKQKVRGWDVATRPSQVIKMP